MIWPIVFTAFAYLFGSVPTAYILGKRLYGRDITQIGSRNVGAVNAWREFGWRAGATVLILDTGKGVLVMALILSLGLNEWVALAAAMAVTIGHNFSIYLRLKGDKGAAVVFGLSFVILPVLTLLAIAIIPIVYSLTRSIIWSFFAGLVALNTLIIATGQPAAQVGLCLSLSILVVVTHLWRTRRDFIHAVRTLNVARLGQIE